MNIHSTCKYFSRKLFTVLADPKRTIYNLKNNIRPCSSSYQFRQFSISRKAFQYATQKEREAANRNTRNQFVALTLFTAALGYAAVPLYRVFCQSTGYGGTPTTDIDGEKVEKLSKVKDRPLKIKFLSDVTVDMTWKFKPQQNEITVYPGETALAFYTAVNPTDQPVIGVSTYNVLPFEAGPYFNKIQCFCFDEQLLNPHEQVDLPVFFYIDPEYADDPRLEHTNEVLLSYTFFVAKEGMSVPLPGFMNQENKIEA